MRYRLLGGRGGREGQPGEPGESLMSPVDAIRFLEANDAARGTRRMTEVERAAVSLGVAWEALYRKVHGP